MHNSIVMLLVDLSYTDWLANPDVIFPGQTNPMSHACMLRYS